MTEQQIGAFEAFLKRELPDHSIEEIAPGTLNLARNAWAAALSHAEGEAVEPIGYLTLQAVARLQGDDRLNGEHLYAFDPDDMSKFRGVYLHPAPQVAVPEALTKYDGYVPPEDGSAGEYYVDGWNSCRDALLANSAPAQTVSASVPEQKTWNQVGGREDLRYTEGWNDCRAAMLAAAPTAPAGELVTRCTAGLGCDEKGYCDAAATGQGDLCDRRTMAHERPVSDPDGLPEPPFDAAHDARVFADRVEMKYGVRCQAGDIADCYEWQQLRQCLAAMAEYVDLATDERDIAALLERIVPRIDPQNPKPLDKSEHCCECTLYYERERIHDEIARLRKLGGNHD